MPRLIAKRIDAVARRWGVPLHPRHLLFWHDLTTDEIVALSRFVESSGSFDGEALALPWTEGPRELLVRLGFLHSPSEGRGLVGEADRTPALLGGLMEQLHNRSARAVQLNLRSKTGTSRRTGQR